MFFKSLLYMGVLQFTLTGKSCRIFSCAVVALSKIGREISLDWKEDQLTLRSLSDTQSAYAAVVLRVPFFEHFTPPSELEKETVVEGGGPGSSSTSSSSPTLQEMQKVKFVSKVLAWACKPTRNVVKLNAYFATQDTTHLFVVRVELLSGLVRTHALNYEDARILQPSFSKATQPFQLCFRPAILQTVLERMHGTEEMSVIASPEVIQFQSYHDGGGEAGAPASVRGPLHTALAYDQTEFDGLHLDHEGAGSDIVRPAYVLAADGQTSLPNPFLNPV